MILGRNKQFSHQKSVVVEHGLTLPQLKNPKQKKSKKQRRLAPLLEEPSYIKVDKTKKFGFGQTSPKGGIKHRKSIGEAMAKTYFNIQKPKLVETPLEQFKRRESIEIV